MTTVASADYKLTLRTIKIDAFDYNRQETVHQLSNLTSKWHRVELSTTLKVTVKILSSFRHFLGRTFIKYFTSELLSRGNITCMNEYYLNTHFSALFMHNVGTSFIWKLQLFWCQSLQNVLTGKMHVLVEEMLQLLLIIISMRLNHCNVICRFYYFMKKIP